MTTKEEQKEKLEIKPSSKIGFIIFVAISLGFAISTFILLIPISPLLFIFVPICFFLTLIMTIIAIYLKKTKKETDFMLIVQLVIIVGVVIMAVTLGLSIYGIVHIFLVR